MAAIAAARRRLAALEQENAELRAEIARLRSKPVKAAVPVVKK
jgi:cell division protein FtsB